MPANANPDGPRLGPRSGGLARQLVVLLHGYGADGNDLFPVAEAWSNVLPHAAFVVPHAPNLHPANFGRQWFPLAFIDPVEISRGVSEATPDLHAFLDDELEALRLSDRSLAIAGFSQGAMMALAVGLSRRTPIAGILSYSGVVAWTPPPAPRLAPPVFLFHGGQDAVVPAATQRISKQALEEAGYVVEAHLQPRLAHGIDSIGLQRGAAFLQRVLPA